MKAPKLADVATAILAGCAIVVTALLIHRELAPQTLSDQSPVRRVSDWRAYGAGGHRIGAANSAVTVVEFSDFQCPFCRQASNELTTLVDSSGGRVAFVYRHFPIVAIHPYALMVAVAAECADRQGRFRAYHDVLFAHQDSIGRRDWARIAADAGVPDTTGFERCVADSAAVMPRIRADIAAGSKLGIRGTPALLINDKLVSGAPTEDELRALVGDVRQAGAPAATKHAEAPSVLSNGRRS